MTLQKKILIIKTGSTVAPLLARGEDFEHWFIAGSGLPATDFLVNSLHLGEALPPLTDVSGIIITGSPAYVTDLEPWNYTGADYLRQAQQQGVPLLGVCYGHQLLAWAFGGKVGFHPGGREIGTVDIETTAATRDDVLMGVLPPRFKAQVSHQQSVTELPPDAIRLAYNQFEPNHAFRLGERTWCVQFHPEFSANVVATYIQQRAEAISDEGIAVQDLLNAVTDTPAAASLLQRFAELCLDLQSAGRH